MSFDAWHTALYCVSQTYQILSQIGQGGFVVGHGHACAHSLPLGAPLKSFLSAAQTNHWCSISSEVASSQYCRSVWPTAMWSHDHICQTCCSFAWALWRQLLYAPNFPPPRYPPPPPHSEPLFLDPCFPARTTPASAPVPPFHCLSCCTTGLSCGVGGGGEGWVLLHCGAAHCGAAHCGAAQARTSLCCNVHWALGGLIMTREAHCHIIQ